MSLSRSQFLGTGLVLVGCASIPGGERTITGDDISGVLLHSTRAHRQVFSSTRIAKGVVLEAARNSLDAFRDGTTETLTPAIVLIAQSSVLAIDDDGWELFALRRLLHLGAGRGNPFLHASPGPPLLDRSIEALAMRGARFFACNNGLFSLASKAAAKHRSSEQRVYREFLAHVVPAVRIVPAGVATVQIAQEAGYHLFVATTAS